jgi:hypothetical protein
LQLAFSHPAIDEYCRAVIRMLDPEGNMLTNAGATSIAAPSDDHGDEGWIMRSTGLEDTVVPPTVTIVLQVGAGLWNVQQERISSDFSGSMSLGQAAFLQGVAMNGEGPASIAIVVQKETMTQFEFVADTHQGERGPRSSWNRSGQRGVNSITFEYPVSLNEVRAFGLHERPIREFVYEDVVLKLLQQAEADE